MGLPICIMPTKQQKFLLCLLFKFHNCVKLPVNRRSADERVFVISTTTELYLVKTIQQVGHQVQYIDNNDLKKFVSKTAALSFVPVGFVQLSWQANKARQPEIKSLSQLISYFKTYSQLGTIIYQQGNGYRGFIAAISNRSTPFSKHKTCHQKRLERIYTYNILYQSLMQNFFI